ncbi:hypothetical protein Ccrd_012565 [Cynara cardunculus var. scolymus]|uniref:Uncharacterized protein n=1 Tax=Cynara cardunculus var. scolymus TaxID=59895 RepID=A0A103YH98_CYNCS|nr:hypothetical protein Ccrd_012565 [Cynara cardunculus var. scolymus]
MENSIENPYFRQKFSSVNHAGSTQNVEDSEKSLAFDSVGDDPWKEEDTALKPCWSKPDLGQCYTLSETNLNIFIDVTDAVVVARYLRATLVIPDIRGSQPGDRGWCGGGAAVVRERETTVCEGEGDGREWWSREGGDEWSRWCRDERETMVCEGEGDGRERWSREGGDEWSRWSRWCGDERETMSELGGTAVSIVPPTLVPPSAFHSPVVAVPSPSVSSLCCLVSLAAGNFMVRVIRPMNSSTSIIPSPSASTPLTIFRQASKLHLSPSCLSTCINSSALIFPFPSKSNT